MKIIDKDRALISMLSENARMLMVEMVRKFGLSRTTVQVCIEWLEADRGDRGLTRLRLSKSYLAWLVCAYVLITIRISG